MTIFFFAHYLYLENSVVVIIPFLLVKYFVQPFYCITLIINLLHLECPNTFFLYGTEFCVLSPLNQYY